MHLCFALCWKEAERGGEPSSLGKEGQKLGMLRSNIRFEWKLIPKQDFSSKEQLSDSARLKNVTLINCFGQPRFSSWKWVSQVKVPRVRSPWLLNRRFQTAGLSVVFAVSVPQNRGYKAGE